MYTVIYANPDLIYKLRLTLHQDEGREMKRVIKHQQGLMDQLENQFNMRYTRTARRVTQ